ncbi:MAG TPA: glycosyltransferase, partial [Aggregatilineaceae bacterium]|nr:glycosyltransferase [Aggregatilineaceae bacterium]
MKLLILSYFYTPDVSPRALRWSTLAEYWVANGYQVTVISAWEPGLLREEVINGVCVYRVHSIWLERLHGWFKQANVNAPQAKNTNRRLSLLSWLRGQFTRAARWFYHAVYKQVYWPDGSFSWYGPARRQALKLTPADVLISVSNPFTGHLVGQSIHRNYSRWVVDVGDPFSLQDIDAPNNRRLYGWLNRRMERDIFRQADAISVTTPATLARYAAAFPESAAKIHLIPPLLAAPLVSHEPEIEPDERIRFVFAGRLYPDIRRPDFMLKLFAGLLHTPLKDSLELHIYGYVREVYDAFKPYTELIDQRIFLHGVVPHVEVMEAMRRASVLVNVGNRTPYQLPSKVVEYASLGKPILNLIQIADDSSVAFFEPHPAVLHLREGDDLAGQVEVLHTFIT